jgi:hypothetical protein
MLSADIESLRIHAGIHSKHLGQYRLLSRRFPFAVYYQLFNDVAYGNAVLDCRRDPAWIMERLK